MVDAYPQDASLHASQHNSTNAAATTTAPNANSNNGNGSGVDAGFFERERNRLIGDISKGVESILGNSNVLNRKLEESISVGKEFHPISELWSKFERIMVASGIPNLYPQQPASNGVNTAGAAAEGGQQQEEGEKDRLGTTTPRGSKKSSSEHQNEAAGGEAATTATETGTELKFELGAGGLGSTQLPPGVAPGGGRIYA